MSFEATSTASLFGQRLGGRRVVLWIACLASIVLASATIVPPTEVRAAGWTSVEFVIEAASAPQVAARVVGTTLQCYDGAVLDGVPEARKQLLYPGGRTSVTVSWLTKAPRCRLGHSIYEGTTTAVLDGAPLGVDATKDVSGINGETPSELFVVDRTRTAIVSVASANGTVRPDDFAFEFRIGKGRPYPSVQTTFVCDGDLPLNNKVDYGAYGGFVSMGSQQLGGNCTITVVSVAPRPPDLRTFTFVHQGRPVAVETPTDIDGQPVAPGGAARLQVPLGQATQVLVIAPDPPLPAGPVTLTSIVPGESAVPKSGATGFNVCFKIVRKGKKTSAKAVPCPKKK